MTKQTRIIIDVRWEDGAWCVRLGPGETPWGSSRPWKKPEAISHARGLAYQLEAYGAYVQVRVFNKNNSLSREWDYPRSSDPKKSKG